MQKWAVNKSLHSKKKKKKRKKETSENMVNHTKQKFYSQQFEFTVLSF